MKGSRRIERLVKKGNVRGLCRLLRHRNALIRRQAAQALGQLGHADAVPFLLRAARRDPDQYVRRWSIQSLEAIATDPAVDALTEVMFSTRVEDARAATQSLRQLASPQAAAALRLRDILTAHDWEALDALDKHGQRALAAVLRSEQYASWPSARRRRVLETALRLGVTPPASVSGELADMGLYVSEVHTLLDLVRGLFHRSPDVRASAATRLADSSQTWATRLLYFGFRREMRKGEERSTAAAFARAMDRLGDSRVIGELRQTLETVGGQPAAEAAYLLADIGTPNAIQALFDVAANPPPPPAYRNVPLVVSAIQRAPDALTVLAPHLDDESASVRRLMVDIVARSNDPVRLSLLAELARDPEPSVCQAALDALAAENTEEAAATLFELSGDLPEEAIARALARFTVPAGVEYIQQLSLPTTVIYGIVRGDDRRPLPATEVQILAERLSTGDETWQWQAVSARALTNEQGEFTLALVDWQGTSRLRLKLVVPARREGLSTETFVAPLPLEHGAANRVEATIDRFFDRLAVSVEPVISR
ncbi:MAG: HEAT repeat domain-containing protein [Aggregatilineales bacterium]